jgi:ABC-type glycerol-3-phosphate transport system permease component
VSAPRAGRRWRWGVYLVLVAALGFFLLPVYLVVVTALKHPAGIRLATAWQLPEVWYWESFVVAWEAFAPKLRNSLVLAVSATVVSAMLGSMNGYVLSKWRFRGADLVFPLMLFIISPLAHSFCHVTKSSPSSSSHSESSLNFIYLPRLER